VTWRELNIKRPATNVEDISGLLYDDIAVNPFAQSRAYQRRLNALFDDCSKIGNIGYIV
jgi:hypothetical protein